MQKRQAQVASQHSLRFQNAARLTTEARFFDFAGSLACQRIDRCANQYEDCQNQCHHAGGAHCLARAIGIAALQLLHQRQWVGSVFIERHAGRRSLDIQIVEHDVFLLVLECERL